MKKLVILLSFLSLVSFANAQCQAGFTYTVNGNTVTLTDASTYSSPMNYTWYFNMGNCGPVNSYSGSNPGPITGLYAGSYQVCLYLSDTMPSTCNSTFCDTITIVNGPHPVCDASYVTWIDSAAPYPVHFYNYNCYNANWYWDFGDGTSSTDQFPIHLYSVNGDYVVCLTTITTSGDTCSFCDTINSTPCPQLLNASYTYSINNNTASFTSNCSGSGLSNPYYWNFGDGTTDNSPNPTHTFLYNGTYSVCLTYMGNTMYCSKIFCDTITITTGAAYPCNPLFSYFPDTLTTNSIYYYDLSSMNIVAWNWSFPGGTPSSFNGQAVSVAYPSAGIYTAYLTVTNLSGVSCTYSNTVNVGNNCTNTLANFNMVPTSTPHVWNVVNMSTGTPPITYSWNWGDGSPFSTGATPNHTYAQAGWYNICVTLSDANGCGSSYCTYDTLYKLYSPESIISVFVTSPTGIEDISLNNVFSIYPNPANDNLTIEAPQGASLKISTMEGLLIKSLTVIKNTTTIDVTTLPAGVYIMEVKTDKGVGVRKFVKE
jgi:PKD repeat protein